MVRQEGQGCECVCVCGVAGDERKGAVGCRAVPLTRRRRRVVGAEPRTSWTMQSRHARPQNPVVSVRYVADSIVNHAKGEQQAFKENGKQQHSKGKGSFHNFVNLLGLLPNRTTRSENLH